MARVFISYSRKDITFAKRLAAELQKSALDYWIDWEGIPPTVDWWQEIENSIEEADMFLFLISPDSAASKVCGQEIDCAIRNAKRIIPIMVRDIKGDEAPQPLRHINWIFFRESDNFDTSFQNLLMAIQSDYAWAATHRRLQVKALDWERNNKDRGFLLRGRDLQDAEQDLATNSSKNPHPSDLQRRYVLVSRREIDKQRRIVTSISIVGVVALAVLALFGFFQAKQARLAQATAQANEQNAEHQAATARAASTLASNNELTAIANLTVAQTAQADAQNKAIISQGLQMGAQSQNLLLANNPIEAFKLKYAVKSQLYNVENSRFPIDLLNVQSDQVSFAISPDGRLLATTLNSQIVLWSTQELGSNPKVLSGHTDIVTVLTFSPDGNILASGGKDNIILLWDLETGNVISFMDEQNDWISSLAFTPPDGRFLISASRDNTITERYIGDPMEPIVVSSFQLKEIVSKLAVSPDGKYLAIGSDNKKLSLWDLSNPESPSSRFSFSFDSPILDLAFSGYANKIVIVTKNAIYIFKADDRLSDPQKINVDDIGNLGLSFSEVLVNFDSTQFAIGCSDGTILIWDFNQITGPPILVKTIYDFAKIDWLH